MKTWKTIPNFPGYEVSTDGEIKNIRTQHILSQIENDLGYMRVDLRKDNAPHRMFVHRVVADAFLGEHPDMIVRHRDEDRSNNRLDNLYWSTQKEAIKDAYDRGSKSAYHSTPVRVVETGVTYNSIKECAEDIGCDRSQIRQCLIGKCRSAKGYHVEHA